MSPRLDRRRTAISAAWRAEWTARPPPRNECSEGPGCRWKTNSAKNPASFWKNNFPKDNCFFLNIFAFYRRAANVRERQESVVPHPALPHFLFFLFMVAAVAGNAIGQEYSVHKPDTIHALTGKAVGQSLCRIVKGRGTAVVISTPRSKVPDVTTK